MVTSAAQSGYLDLPDDGLSEYAIAPKISSVINQKIPEIPRQLLSQDHQDFLLSLYEVMGAFFAPS